MRLRITNQYRSIKTSAGKCEQDLVCDNHNSSRGISSLYLSDELSATEELLVNRTNQADGMYKRWQRPFYYTQSERRGFIKGGTILQKGGKVTPD